jgi:hypothetical protein
MIVVWNKKTKQILHQTMDMSLAANYELYAHKKDVGFFCKPEASAFPESGYVIDSESGDYRPMTYAEKVKAKLASVLRPDQKIVVDSNGVEQAVPLTDQEQLKAGLITLSDLRSKQKTFLYFEATTYLNSSFTKNGYSTSDAAQRIALNSIQMKNVSNQDEDLKSLTSAGLIYPLDKAREILTFCASVTASFREACKAVDSAVNVAQISSIHLNSYL